MKNSELISSFVNDNFFSEETYKCNNLSVKDHKLFSYSTCIAEWVSIDSILINFNGYSNTTKKHKNTLQSYLHYEITKNGKNYDIKYVHNVPINAQELKMYYLNNLNMDLTEILKDCPIRTKFYSSYLGKDVFFIGIYDNWIKCEYTSQIDSLNSIIQFRKDGSLYKGGECMLFPSKDQRDWSKWHRPFVDGDVLSYQNKLYKNRTIYIYRHHSKMNTSYYVALSASNDFMIGKDGDALNNYNDTARFATEEEKQKLFDALKKEGYEWDAEKKELKPLQQFKDGDIVATNDGKYIAIIENNGGKYYVCCHPNINYFHIDRSGWFDRLATEEEKATLFQAIKDNGYKWNAETKTLEKVKKEKFDPKTLQPFDKVLVSSNDEWFCDFFSHYDNDVIDYNCICTGGCPYECCIPYNDDTKHLIGKSIEEAPEFYRYWEE